MRSPALRTVWLGLALSVPALAVTGYLATGCVFGSANDCELTLGFGCSTSGTTSSSHGGQGGSAGGAGGTTSNSSSATTSGGSGGTVPTSSVECTDVLMCAGISVPPGRCASFGKVACTGGKCVVEYTPGEAPSQRYGDCKKTLCDESGVAADVDDDGDVYDDGNPCTQETCNAGMLETTMLFNMPCTLGGSSGFCVPDPYNPALLVCSECISTGDCTGSAICMSGHCVPAHCNDSVTSMNETDKNCGGGTQSGCLKCSAGKACFAGSADCASGICTSMKCAAATCSDGVQNADETDVDCSGLNCPEACADNRKCITGADCKSFVCAPSATPGMPNTCQPATCTDGVQNGDEADIDCGGATSLCPPCPP